MIIDGNTPGAQHVRVYRRGTRELVSGVKKIDTEKGELERYVGIDWGLMTVVELLEGYELEATAEVPEINSGTV